jgi:hypothetical protein
MDVVRVARRTWDISTLASVPARPVLLADPPDWTAHAACRDQATADADPWHPADHVISWWRIAAQICAGCPVRAECREYGLTMLASAEVKGMFGGLTPDELRKLARRQGRPSRRVAQHGTRARYVSGYRCELCKSGNSRSEHARRRGSAA